nr:T5orf172 domain protein [Kaumoebavirus]
MMRSVYIVGSDFHTAFNVYKVGYHSGDEKALRKRYVTPVPRGVLLFKDKGLRDHEQKILYAFAEHREPNINEGTSEWIRYDYDKLEAFVKLTLRNLPIGEDSMKEIWQNCIPQYLKDLGLRAFPKEIKKFITPEMLLDWGVADKKKLETWFIRMHMKKVSKDSLRAYEEELRKICEFFNP